MRMGERNEVRMGGRNKMESWMSGGERMRGRSELMKRGSGGRRWRK